MSILKRSWEIIRTQVFFIPFLLILIYALDITSAINVINKTPSFLCQLVSPNFSGAVVPNNPPNPSNIIATPNTPNQNVISNAEENNKFASEILKTLLTIAITLFITILVAIITLYQNLYKNIDDKFSNIKKELKEDISKLVKSELSDEFDKIIKQSEEELGKITKNSELTIKIDNLIQNIKNEFAKFYFKNSHGVTELTAYLEITTDLVRLEMILRYIASADNKTVTKNLKHLKSFLMTPENSFEQAVLDYLRLLYKNAKFSGNEEGEKYLIENIVEDFYRGAFK